MGKVRWYTFLQWQDLIATVVAAILWLVLALLESNPLYIPPNDSNSLFPTTENAKVPTWLCAVIIVVVGAATILPLFFIAPKFPNIFVKFNLFACIWCLVSCEAFSGAAVNLFKNYVGRARPDIYDLCGPNVTASPESCPKLSEKDFYDQYKSWPSGHSQTAMSGLYFLALFVQHAFVPRQIWTSLIAALYIILAIYIGSTRIRDFRHHPDDVLAGFFVGFLFTQLIWERMKKTIFTPVDEEEENEQEDKSAPTGNAQTP